MYLKNRNDKSIDLILGRSPSSHIYGNFFLWYHVLRCSFARTMPDIMTALPSGAVTRTFSRLKYVQLEAEKIAETLEKDEEESGNQFLFYSKQPIASRSDSSRIMIVWRVWTTGLSLKVVQVFYAWYQGIAMNSPLRHSCRESLCNWSAWD